MPDDQQRPGPSFNTTFQPASVLDHPGVTKPNGGVARAIAFARGISGKAVVLAVVVFGLQAAMPEGRRPSDLIGGFHGNTESAEIKAKQEAAAEFERRMADAKAAPPANWQMEAEAFRQQQEVTARSLETMATAAQIADAACIGSPLVTMFMGNTRDARDLQNTLQGACAEAERIRANMTRIQAETARQGSALMQRNIPVASTPLTTPAHGR
jgi:hypothetical protein